MTRHDREAEPLVRQFTVLGLWLLVINGLIGAGIFGVPAEAARLTGIYSPLMFLLCGLLMTPIILSFGEVSSYFHGTGGPIVYTRTAFGPAVGFQTGWTLYVSRVTAFGANANLLISSLAFLWEGADQGATRIALLFLICGGLTWVNVVGAGHAMRSLGLLTLLKLLPLLLLVGLGVTWLDARAFPFAERPAPDFGDIGTAALVLMYAYVGFEGALIPAGEARDPKRDMPRALFWALGLVTLLYVLIQAISVAVLPDLESSRRPLIDVGEALMGPAGAILVAAGVVVSVGGNIAAAMLSAPRMTYVMARHGTLPAVFGRVSDRYRTPAVSIVLYGGLSFVLGVYGSFAWLAGLTVLARLLIYVLSISAIPYLRRTHPDATDRLLLPGGYLIPGLAIAVSVWLIMQVDLAAFVVTAGFLAAGVVLYLVARRGQGAEPL
jgi:amino acid transporter